MQNKKQKSYSYCLENELSTRLLSEQEASTLAGVSLETLIRYQEFGLLKPVFRNELPFYRESEVNTLFMLEKRQLVEKEHEVKKPVEKPLKQELNKEDVPTLSGLLSENLSEVKPEPKFVNSDLNISNKVAIQEEAPVPAVRLEDIIFENRNLKDKLSSLEDERDWLRKRVEQLEERSGREQMLLLSEKETLREVLGATIVNPNRIESRYSSRGFTQQNFGEDSVQENPSFQEPVFNKQKPEETQEKEEASPPVTLSILARKLKNFLS